MASTDFCFHISDLDLPPSSPNLLLDENDNDIDETSFGASFPDLPITYSELYQQLLVGLMEPARVIWWPILPQINRSQSIIQSYPKLKENSLKRYQWVRERSLSSTNNDYLTLYEVYQHRQHEILLLLTEIIDFDIILMKKFVEIIIHIIPSNDICFHLCSTILISRKGYWIGLNYNEHQLNLQIFYEIMKTYLTNFPPITTTTTSTSTSTTSSITFDLLISCRILDDTFLNHIFLNFFTTILPWCHVLRILDLYLLEGKIILYRFGMGLIYHYLYLLNDNDSTSSNSINFRSYLSFFIFFSYSHHRNGKAFWSEVAIRSKTMKFHDLYETTMSVGNK